MFTGHHGLIAYKGFSVSLAKTQNCDCFYNLSCILGVLAEWTFCNNCQFLTFSLYSSGKVEILHAISFMLTTEQGNCENQFVGVNSCNVSFMV